MARVCGLTLVGGLFCLISVVAPLRAQTNVLDQLKARFNRDTGLPKLILLVSPT